MKTPAPTDDVNWAALLRNAEVVDLAAVREMKEAHRRLLDAPGPPPVAAFVRLFRLVNLFALFALQKKRFPVLNRAWADLQWVMKHPELDEFAVNGWLLFDLPVTDDGRTVVEVFAAEIAPDDGGLRAFVEEARRSRYGIYVDDGGTGSSQRLVELLTRRRRMVVRSASHVRGELIWTRIIEHGGMTFMLGDTRGWPPPYRDQVADMLVDRIEDSRWADETDSPEAAYEQFMKLSGPYWFSVLFSRSDRDPVLMPDHYLAYRKGPVPDFVVPQTRRR